MVVQHLTPCRFAPGHGGLLGRAAVFDGQQPDPFRLETVKEVCFGVQGRRQLGLLRFLSVCFDFGEQGVGRRFGDLEPFGHFPRFPFPLQGGAAGRVVQNQTVDRPHIGKLQKPPTGWRRAPSGSSSRASRRLFWNSSRPPRTRTMKSGWRERP